MSDEEKMSAWLRDHVVVGTDGPGGAPRLVIDAAYFSLADADAERFARHILSELQRVRDANKGGES